MNAEKPKPQDSCPYPWTGDNGTKAQCVANGHCGCGYEKGAFVSGQYAELVEVRPDLIERLKKSRNFLHGRGFDDCADACREAASALTTLTQQQPLPFDLTHIQIEEFRRENLITQEQPMPDWAVEENRVLNAVCDIAAGKLTAWKAMGDSTVPVANGGASTTASGPEL